jgi:hypothetical protein
MLNLLAEYAGYQSWADFKNANEKKLKDKKKVVNKYIPGFIILIGLLAVLSISFLSTQNEVKFCVVDESGQPIHDVRVIWLLPDQSERVLNLQNNCVKIKTDNAQLHLRIESPYYKNIIIHRKIDMNDYNENIVLQTDLNAFLLKHYSNSNSDNWQKRRHHLQNIISDSALIYQQWFEGEKGIELYDKDEFIGQLCVPTGWIKNLEILEITYKNNQIIKLRFSTKKQK